MRDGAVVDVSSGFHSHTRYALISVVNMIKIELSKTNYTQEKKYFILPPYTHDHLVVCF